MTQHTEIEPEFCPDLLNDKVQSKWLQSLPEEEQQPVCELYNLVVDMKTEELQEHMQVDTLIRWLRFKKLDVAAAAKELRSYLEWRQEFKVDEKCLAFDASEARKIFEKYTCSEFFGKDKNGVPVLYSPMGSTDPGGIVELIGSDNWMLAHLAAIERDQREQRVIAKESGKCITARALVIDVTGFECHRARKAIDVYADTAKLLDRYYPLRSSKVLLVNCPWLFTACWKIAKGIMDDATVAAIGVYGEKSKDWIPDFTEIVDIEEIPEAYGGKKGGDWKLPEPSHKVDKKDMLEEMKKKKS